MVVTEEKRWTGSTVRRAAIASVALATLAGTAVVVLRSDAAILRSFVLPALGLFFESLLLTVGALVAIVGTSGIALVWFAFIHGAPIALLATAVLAIVYGVLRLVARGVRRNSEASEYFRKLAGGIVSVGATLVTIALSLWGFATKVAPDIQLRLIIGSLTLLAFGMIASKLNPSSRPSRPDDPRSRERPLAPRIERPSLDPPRATGPDRNHGTGLPMVPPRSNQRRTAILTPPHGPWAGAYGLPFAYGEEPPEEEVDGPIRGWRVWQVAGGILRGMRVVWPGSSLEATCHRCVEPPGWLCSCGIYVLRDAMDAFRLYQGMHRLPRAPWAAAAADPPPTVIGRVEVEGSIIEHDAGYRAESVRIVELWTDDAATAALLSRTYADVEVHIGLPPEILWHIEEGP